MNAQMDKIKGRIKQAAGELTGNKRLKAEGKKDEARGVLKNKIEKAAVVLKKRI